MTFNFTARFLYWCMYIDENSNNTYMSNHSWTSCQLVPHFIMKKHIHHFGICGPKDQCYLNYVIQLLIPTLRAISHNFHFNYCAESSLLKCLFKTAHNASNSTGVGAANVQYYMIYDGQIQQDVSECFLMLIEAINKGPVPYCGSTDGFSIWYLIFIYVK